MSMRLTYAANKAQAWQEWAALATEAESRGKFGLVCGLEPSKNASIKTIDKAIGLLRLALQQSDPEWSFTLPSAQEGTMSTQHTATPWAWQEWANGTAAIEDTRGGEDLVPPGVLSPADAEFIVRACNSHRALVKAIDPVLLDEAAALLADYHPEVANALADAAQAQRTAINKATQP